MNSGEIRNEFPELMQKVHGKNLVYLDNAATTLKPRQVIDSLTRHFSERAANIHRGVHFLSEQATEDFEGARAKIKKFINARSECEVIFTSGTTDSINLVAQSLGASMNTGDEIIITHMEHHSNIVPWQMLCERKGCVLKVVPMNRNGELEFESYKNLLSDKTRLVAMTQVSNALGTVNPVDDYIRAAHARDIPVLIDGAQAVAHLPVDVAALDCDFYAFSGHKLFGPTGIGVLYGKEKLLEKMPPVKGGGDMIRSVTFAKTEYNDLPYKFEAGTPAIAEAIALGEAVDFVGRVGFSAITEHEKVILAYAHTVLSSMPEVEIIGTAKNKSGVVSFSIRDIHPHDIGTIVDQEGVAIRTGHHCAQPVMDYFEIPATSRASFSIYNSKEDVDALARAIKTAITVFT